jgi:predicted flap endonuclease-1-like 5' DNA nuclease
VLGEGQGRSKKEAQQEAARRAWATLAQPAATPLLAAADGEAPAETGVGNGARRELRQLKGVGPQLADLLAACGAVTVGDLATRDAPALRRQLADANVALQLLRRLPTEAKLGALISQASGGAAG